MKKLFFILLLAPLAVFSQGNFSIPYSEPRTLASGTIAGLYALQVGALVDSTISYISGYYTPNDGGGGTFVWNHLSTLTDDGGTVIKPTGIVGAGRFIRQYVGAINVLWLGIKADGVTDNKVALTKLYAKSNVSYYFPAGNYYANTEIPITGSNITTTGDGWVSQIIGGSTRLFFVGSTSVKRLRYLNLSFSTSLVRATDTAIAGLFVVAPDSAGAGLRGITDSGFLFSGVRFRSPNASINAFSGYPSEGNLIIGMQFTNGCLFDSVGRMGIEIAGQAHDTVLVKNTVVDGNTFQNLGTQGNFGMAVSFGTFNTGSYVNGNFVYNWLGPAIEPYECIGATVTNNKFEHGFRTGCLPIGLNAFSAAKPGHDNVISGNVVSDSVYQLSYYHNNNNCTITGNKERAFNSYTVMTGMNYNKFRDNIWITPSSQVFLITTSSNNTFDNDELNDSAFAGFSVPIDINDGVSVMNKYINCVVKGGTSGHVLAETTSGGQGNVFYNLYRQGFGGTAGLVLSYNLGTPTIAAGTGAGTSPTISITGDNQHGFITLTTGSTPSTSAVIATITFSAYYSFLGSSVTTITPGNAASIAGAQLVYTTGSAGAWTLNSGGTALSASTAYIFKYNAEGY